jgi:hypothetical protein
MLGNQVEHLTQDGEGYVYWKGASVEHYSFRDPAKEVEAAQELAARCRHLEALGVRVSTGTAIWYWGWFEGLTRESLENLPSLVCQLITSSRDLYEQGNRFCWLAEHTDRPGEYPYTVKARVCVFEAGSITSFWLDSDDLGGFYHPLTALGWQIAQMGQRDGNGCCYATTDQVLGWFERKGAM